MHILDRYIANSVIIATGLVVLTLLGIETLLEFINELSSFGTGHYGLLQLFVYVAMQLPSDLYQLFPIAGFLGSLIGLGRMAMTSELIVICSAGVSKNRIAWAVIKAALFMLIFVTFLGEWQAPKLEYQSRSYKAQATGKLQNLWSHGDLWLHQENTFVRIGAILSKTQVLNIARFDFDKQNHLLTALVAEKAELEKGKWQLVNISTTQFVGDQVQATHLDKQPLGFTFHPQLLEKKMQRDSEQQTIQGLWRNIQYRHQAGLLASELEFAFWQRLMQPFTTIVMICLGVPFVFGSLRQVSMSSRVLTGIIVGFSFYMLNQFLGPIALVYQWPAWIAATLPTLFFLFIYLVLSRKY